LLQNTAQPSQQQIEQLFDGNICRCTGAFVYMLDVRLVRDDRNDDVLNFLSRMFFCLFDFPGYRSILDGMQTFASSTDIEDLGMRLCINHSFSFSVLPIIT
jgi:hypothetical protein